MEKLKGESMLLTAAMIWGGAFMFQKMAMDFVGPLAFTAWRFGLGTLIMIPVVLMRRTGIRGTERCRYDNKQQWKTLLTGGCLIGLVNFAGSEFQQIGIVYTSAGKAGFITSMDMVIVPLLLMIMGKRVHLLTWIGIAVSVVGLFMLCMDADFGFQTGDLLCLCGAVGFALQILLIDHFVKKTDPLELAVCEFAVTALLATIAALLFEGIDLSAAAACIWPILYTAVLEICVAFSLQVLGQQYTPPAIATITMSMESVFAVLCGALFLGETMSCREINGCILMFTAFIIAQIPEIVSENHLINLKSLNK